MTLIWVNNIVRVKNLRHEDLAWIADWVINVHLLTSHWQMQHNSNEKEYAEYLLVNHPV